MDKAELHKGIRDYYESIEATITTFNEWWPQHFRAGGIWPLPIADKANTEFVLKGPEECLTGEALVPEAQRAIKQLHMLERQNPQTVLRMPGWIALSEPPTKHLRDINAAREALSAFVDAKLTECGQQFAQTTLDTYRGRAIRKALPGISLRHLFRKIHGFDQTPVLISFIWVGQSTSQQISTVRVEREKLEALLEARRKEEGSEGKMTATHPDIVAFQKLPDDRKVVVVRQNSGHPRAMLFFNSGSTWDAMPRANLPIFVYCPEGHPLPKCNPLQQPDRERKKKDGTDDERGKRRDLRQRMPIATARPDRMIYLYDGEECDRIGITRLKGVRSTYGAAN